MHWLCPMRRTTSSPGIARIRNHSEYFSDERAKDFFDKDATLHRALSELRDQLSRKLHREGEDQITASEVDLRPADNGKKLEVTLDHLARMCSDIETRLVQIIEKEISEYWRPTIGGAEPQAPVEATGPSEARKPDLHRAVIQTRLSGDAPAQIDGLELKFLSGVP